jgi:hypothetical protein
MSSSISKTSRISEPESYSEPIHLNGIMQQALQRLQHVNKGLDLIVRSEVLPVIEGDKKTIVRVFDDIVHMIVSPPPTGTRLFLYVDCEEEPKEASGAELVKIYKRYTLNFHTNINTNEAWKTAHEKTIARCRTLLAQYGASFTVKEVKSTGCLFSISLLGKM